MRSHLQSLAEQGEKEDKKAVWIEETMYTDTRLVPTGKGRESGWSMGNAAPTEKHEALKRKSQLGPNNGVFGHLSKKNMLHS